jgi:hypothetical protein
LVNNFSRSNVLKKNQIRLKSALALIFTFLMYGQCFAGETASPATEAPKPPKTVLDWETGAGKSYLIPAFEIPIFIAGLNGVDRLASPNEMEDGKKVYSSNLSTFWDHTIHGPWVLDHDSFQMNQLNHPYAGTIYYGFARSAGLTYWESLGYTVVGSFLWETAGETTKPSVNDEIATGVGGTFLGEPLFRMASLLLEGGGGRPGFWRELGAAVISPPTGVNRYIFGERFKSVFPSHDPAIFSHLQLGAGLNVHLFDGTNTSVLNRNDWTADYLMAYGLPGKPGYSYDRPFDYFQFQLTLNASGKNVVEDVTSRGLLYGAKYDIGSDYRGIWGIYGTYDYMSPHIFRVSSTAVNLGTTAQWWLSRSVALQGSLLGGGGYGAAGLRQAVGLRDYHYGIAAQGLIDLKLLLGDKAFLGFTRRECYVSGTGSSEPGGWELIGRQKAEVSVRVYKNFAIGTQYVLSNRNAKYPGRANSNQSLGTLRLLLTYLSDTKFGAVEWRDAKAEMTE